MISVKKFIDPFFKDKSAYTCVLKFSHASANHKYRRNEIKPSEKRPKAIACNLRPYIEPVNSQKIKRPKIFPLKIIANRWIDFIKYPEIVD